MIDQSHNLKNKVEEMIQTATTAQELYIKAALVDHESLAEHQKRAEIIDAEECLKAAFAADVRPVLREWRKSKGLAADALAEFRKSGYTERAAAERGAKNREAAGSYA
jgi:L-rhamnose isomerase/sugar isomerase